MAEQISYRREDDGHWRWLYVNSEADVELRSSKTYPSASQARHAAADLYPGVPLAGIADPPPVEDDLAPAKLLRSAAVSTGLLVLLLRGLKGVGKKRAPQPSQSPAGRRGQHRGVTLSRPGSLRR